MEGEILVMGGWFWGWWLYLEIIEINVCVLYWLYNFGQLQIWIKTQYADVCKSILKMSTLKSYFPFKETLLSIFELG